MKKVFIVLFFVHFSICSHAQANKQDVKIFLELSGKFSLYNEMANQFAKQLADSKREAFKKDINVFIERISNRDVDRYAAAFSQDEIVKLIEFYKSPLGKKMIEKNVEFNKASVEEANQNDIELQGIIMKYMM